MSVIGYMRVSTDEQNLALQRDALTKAGCERIFEDKATGTNMERAGLTEALSYCRPGDVLTVWKLDRIGRNTLGTLTVIKDLSARGISFRSLTEGLDTSTPIGSFITTVLAAFAELEAKFITERTRAGMAQAKADGKRFGRPAPQHLAAEAKRVTKLAAQGNTRGEIARIMRISETTVRRRQRWAQQNL